MTWNFIELRTRKYVKGNWFISFARNVCNRYRKQLLDTGLGALKPASKKLIYKAVQATGEFTGNKIANKIVKPKHVINEDSRNVEEIIIVPEKREEILNKLTQVF